VSRIFIIGSGRSGNTLLRRILTGSEELYIPPETYVLGDTIRNFPEYSRLEWPSTCQLILGKFASLAGPGCRADAIIQAKTRRLAQFFIN